MNEINYRIKYRKGDFEVEVQGDKTWVEKKFEELISEEMAIKGEKVERVESMPETLGEFLDIKGNPKKHTDVVAIFAYWLLHVEKVKLFNAEDIERCYDLTRKTKPKNIHSTIDKNVQRHIFADAKEKKDGKKAWIITRTGEEYVEQLK